MAANDEKLITLSNLEEFKNNLATVAISNDYDDLDNKPVMEYENTTNNTNRIKKDLSLRKVYTGVLGVTNGSATADKNTYANNSFYFLNVFPRSWYSEWTVKYHLNIHLDNESQTYKSSSTATVVQAGQVMRGLYECMISGTQGAYSTFHFFQSQKNTSYRPIYYHMTHSPNTTGHNAGEPFKIGISLVSSYLPVPSTDYSSGSAVTTKYPRTIEVVVDEAINCEVSLNDTLEVEADAYVSSTNDMGNYTKLNSTYYTTNTSASNSAGRWNTLSATTQGLYKSGDDNTYTYTQQSSNYLKNGTTYSDGSAGYTLGYSMIGFDKDGKVLAISKKSPTTTAYNTGIDQTRVYCNAGFDYSKGIRYISTSTNFAANADMNLSTQINYSGLDFRYNDNCVAGSSANTLGLVNREPVYLRGTIGDDGLFYLDPIEVTYSSKTYKRVWVQPGDATRLATSPFDTNHVYWFVGYPYYNNSYPNSLYQLNLITQGELNKWNGTKLVPYTGIEGVTSVDWSGIQNKPTFATVATSGSYNDLTNKPTIPAAQVNSDWNASSGVAQILNKPTIPTVNNSTITIKKNNSDIGDSFTTNASSGKTINLGLATVATSGSYNDLSDKLVTNSTYNATTNKIATMAEILPYEAISGIDYTVSGNQLSNISTGLKQAALDKRDILFVGPVTSDASNVLMKYNNKYTGPYASEGVIVYVYSADSGSIFHTSSNIIYFLFNEDESNSNEEGALAVTTYIPTNILMDSLTGNITLTSDNDNATTLNATDIVNKGLPSYTQTTDLGKTLTITSDGIDWQAPLSASIDTTNKTITVGSNSVSYGTTGNNKLLQLNSSGKIDSSVLPPVAITDTSVVNSQAAMLALTAQVGDICVRTDLNKSYILKEDGASTLSHWQELLTPTDTVTSVAGKTGAVTLGASDVGITVTTSSVSDGANTFTKYSHPTTTATTAGLYKVGKDSLGHVVLGDSFTLPTNSWRPIKVGGSNALTDTSTALNFLNTGNVTFTYDSGLKASVDLSGYQPKDADLTAIAGLTGTSGILKKTAADTWTLDTNTYYLASNPNGYTSNTGTVIGSGLDSEYFVVGNGTVNIKKSSTKPTTSSTSWSTSSDVNIPTMKSISSYVTSLGYVTSSGVTSVATSGTGLSGGTITTTGTITLDSSSAGNAAANKVVLRNAAGSIQSEKIAISSGTTTKATMQYDSTNDCIKFVFS